MDHEIYDPTIKTSIENINGPVDDPGSLVETTLQGETTYVLDRTIMIIGSDDAADIRIEGRSIASYHAEIIHDDGGYQIRHLDGSAPVRVNGEAVRESTLADGDAVVLGEHTFFFMRRSPSLSSE